MAKDLSDRGLASCQAFVPRPDELNPKAVLPYGLKPGHVLSAMAGFCDFLTFINTQLHSKGLERFETMLMPANFSSMVGEFMSSNIPKYCGSLVKNRYHNGHPDMLPKGVYTGDLGQHVDEGIEVKASRYAKRWQGHNPEAVWLMVFVFDSNRPVDVSTGAPTRPFRFLHVFCGKLTEKDWLFAGRSETSRRTITASVLPSGYSKMSKNWIYRAADAEVMEAKHEAEID